MNKRNRESNAKGRIARLERELEAERRHSAALERELAAIKRELQDAEDADRDRPWRQLRRRRQMDGRTRTEEKLREGASRRAQHYRKGSFVRYSWESVMDSLPVRVLSQLWTYLRRLRVVRLVLTLVPAVGAVVLVTLLSAAALPFFLVGTAVLGLLGWLRSRRMNHILRRELEGRHLRVFVPSRGAALTDGSFLERQAHAMTLEGQVAVLIVSPYLVSRRGMGGRGGYFTARKEADNLFMVRRHYFFILRKRVLDVVDPDMTVIY